MKKLKEETPKNLLILFQIKIQNNNYEDGLNNN